MVIDLVKGEEGALLVKASQGQADQPVRSPVSPIHFLLLLSLLRCCLLLLLLSPHTATQYSESLSLPFYYCTPIFCLVRKFHHYVHHHDIPRPSCSACTSFVAHSAAQKWLCCHCLQLRSRLAYLVVACFQCLYNPRSRPSTPLQSPNTTSESHLTRQRVLSGTFVT